MDPINYGMTPANPIQGFTQGFNLISGIRNQLDARAAQQAQMEAEAQRQQQLSQAMARVRAPGSTAQDRIDYLMLLSPEQSKASQDAFAQMDKAQQQSALEDAGKLVSAFKSGNKQIALDMLDERIAGLKNAGDDKGAEFLSKVRQSAEVNPSVAENFFANSLALMPGGKDVLDSMNKNLAAPYDRALTEAQTAEAWSRIYQSKLPKELTPEQVVTAERDLRNEYNNRTADFQKIRSAVQTINSTDNSGAGDIALVYAYMKMLDPTSVVREGEFATAQNSGSIPEFVMAQYNKALKGEMLTPSIRDGFRKQAKALYANAAKGEEVIRKGIERVATNNGFNLQNIFYQDQSPEAPGGTPAATPNTSATPPIPTTGKFSVVAPNGKTYEFDSQAKLDAFKTQAGIK